MRSLSNQTGISQQPEIVEREVLAELGRTHADQSEKMACESIGAALSRLLALVTHHEVMLFPGPVEKCDQAVVEDVEERAQGFILIAGLRQQQFGVMRRQRAFGSGKPQEGDSHVRDATLPGNFMNLTGREIHRSMRVKANRLLARRRMTPDG